MRSKYAIMEAERKQFYLQAQLVRKKNKELIESLQIDNKELKEQAKNRDTSIINDSGILNAEKIDKDLTVWRRKLDEMKNKTLSKKEHLKSLHDKQVEISKEHVDSDDNPHMRTIRVMENRLDKAMIKYNEAISIKKTYELIVKRLKEERTGYDSQLSSIEQSLKSKESDFEELLTLSQDANYAKDLAETDLKSYETQIDQQLKPIKPRVGNRFFANQDESINMINMQGVLDTSGINNSSAIIR